MNEEMVYLLDSPPCRTVHIIHSTWIILVSKPATSPHNYSDVSHNTRLILVDVHFNANL